MMKYYLKTGPALNPDEEIQEAQRCYSFIMESNVGSVINDLWLDLAQEETKVLTQPHIEREEAYRRADELRTQRLMLERIVDELDIRIDKLNSAGDDNDSPDTEN